MNTSPLLRFPMKRGEVFKLTQPKGCILRAERGDLVLRRGPAVGPIERLAIRSEHRGNGYAHQLLGFMLNLGRQKGFSRFYLHAQARLQPFYQRYGFQAVGGDFAFSDHDYVEMVLNDRDQPAQPSQHIGQWPMALNRPENNLHRGGPLKRRAAMTGRRQAVTGGAE